MIEKICKNCQKYPCLKNNPMMSEDKCSYPENFSYKEHLVIKQPIIFLISRGEGTNEDDRYFMLYADKKNPLHIWMDNDEGNCLYPETVMPKKWYIDQSKRIRLSKNLAERIMGYLNPECYPNIIPDFVEKTVLTVLDQNFIPQITETEKEREKKGIKKEDDFISRNNHDKRFFEDGKLKPSMIADEIMQDYTFRTTTDNETIYYYHNGIYHDGGEILIKKEAKKRYDDITSHQQNEVIMHIATTTYTDRNNFNNNPNLIHLQNEIFNFGTMKTQPFTSEVISTVQIPVIYHNNTDCPKIKKFLNEILQKDDVPIIQELFGYLLYRDYPIQKAFMMVGSGSNGKSVLLNLCRHFLGKNNVSSLPLQQIDDSRNRFSKASLFGKLANINNDLSSAALRETGTFKMLTGGDTITAEKKFHHSFAFQNHAKLIFATNQLPETKDDSLAFFRRWIIIKFLVTFTDETADKTMIKKITDDNEISGLFNWAVEGLKRLLDNGVFSTSKTTLDVSREYKRLSSPLLAFVEDRIVVDKNSWVSKDEVYNTYIDYCGEHNLFTWEKNVFGRKISQFVKVRSVRKKDGKVRINGWEGIKLKEEEPDGNDARGDEGGQKNIDGYKNEDRDGWDKNDKEEKNNEKGGEREESGRDRSGIEKTQEKQQNIDDKNIKNDSVVSGMVGINPCSLVYKMEYGNKNKDITLPSQPSHPEKIVNKIGKWVINHYKTHKGIPMDFLIKDTLSMFPNADPEEIKNAYNILKQQKKEEKEEKI